MDNPILQTKLFIPRPQQFVHRPRLTKILDAGKSQNHRLILISAGAGSGKTGLIADWIQQTNQITAWLSIDEGDNDPARFWSYFLAALKTIIAEQIEDISGKQQKGQSFLISVLNKLAHLSHTILIVLDDYHLITNPEIHQALDFWLKNAPPQVTLVINTRSDPPFSLNHLRVHQEMSELREVDLRFRLNEIALFLKERAQLSLTETDLITLEKRTEGWAAGLQLAALVMTASFQTEISPHSFIENFSSSQKYILDYLAEEVLLRQPLPIQDFLLKTSILSHLCASLCAEVLEAETIQKTQQTLIWLEQNNLFTQSLDDQAQWFRYHQLFADLLQNQCLLKYSPEQIKSLHQRAAVWLTQHGDIEEAILHAIRGEDYLSAAQWISETARKMMFDGRINTLKDWLDALPANIFSTHPRLAIYQIWIELLQGKKSIDDQTIQETEVLLASLSDGKENFHLQIELKVILSRFIALSGNAKKAIQYAEDVLPHLDEQDLASRARVNSALTIAYSFLGDVSKAQQTYQLCLQQAFQSANYSLAAHTTYLIAFGQTMHGKLHLAQYFYQSILDMGKQSGEDPFYPAGQGYIGLAGLCLEWNEINHCRDYLKKGINLCSQAGLDGLFQAKITTARMFQAAGEYNKALDEILPLFKSSARENFSTLTTRQISILINMGNIDAAAQAAMPLAALLDSPEQTQLIPIHFLEVLKISLARVYLAQGKFNQASQLLAEVLDTAQPANRNEHVLEIQLARILLADQQSPDKLSPAGLSAMGTALEIAEPEGYCLLFKEYGERLIPYLQAVIQKENLSLRFVRHAQKILHCFTGPENAALFPKPSPAAEKSPDTLTKREYQMLKLIRDGKTNQEISEQLILSPHTVKKHIRNLYLKLGVNSRTQAVLRAEELNLL